MHDKRLLWHQRLIRVPKQIKHPHRSLEVLNLRWLYYQPSNTEDDLEKTNADNCCKLVVLSQPLGTLSKEKVEQKMHSHTTFLVMKKWKRFELALRPLQLKQRFGVLNRIAFLKLQRGIS